MLSCGNAAHCAALQEPCIVYCLCTSPQHPTACKRAAQNGIELITWHDKKLKPVLTELGNTCNATFDGDGARGARAAPARIKRSLFCCAGFKHRHFL